MPTAIRLACGRRLCNVYAEVGECGRPVEQRRLPLGQAVYLPGPLAGNWSAGASRAPRARACASLWARPDPAGRLARALRVVLWVREPLARVLGCWNALIGSDAAPPLSLIHI